jgi:hypothetical protein
MRTAIALALVVGLAVWLRRGAPRLAAGALAGGWLPADGPIGRVLE